MEEDYDEDNEEYKARLEKTICDRCSTVVP